MEEDAPCGWHGAGAGHISWLICLGCALHGEMNRKEPDESMSFQERGRDIHTAIPEEGTNKLSIVHEERGHDPFKMETSL